MEATYQQQQLNKLQNHFWQYAISIQFYGVDTCGNTIKTNNIGITKEQFEQIKSILTEKTK